MVDECNIINVFLKNIYVYKYYEYWLLVLKNMKDMDEM